MSFPNTIVKKVTVAGKEITLEFNKYAKQANGSVMVTCGDTQVLVTVCASDTEKENPGFFPLSVDYFERLYATGRIPGGFIKRETKPSDHEVLISRVIDRPIRPCFPEGFMTETQVTCLVLSYDPKNHPASLAMLGASSALMISDIPFDGPVASLRVGLENGEFVVDPLESEDSELDLTIAAKPGATLMVEAGANFLSEEKILDAIDFAHKAMQPLFDMQLQIQKEIGRPKRHVPENPQYASVYEKVAGFVKDRVKQAFNIPIKHDRKMAFRSLADDLYTALNPDKDSKLGHLIAKTYEDLQYKVVRQQILDEKVRIDGRGLKDIRPIACETGLLKRPHGSALFQRGETQALASVTLGSGDDEQRLDNLVTPNIKKTFMLHYNFPGFSVGEVKPNRGPGRREVGHGALAERALSRVIPDRNKFGYTIRLVSEILESNGSSSMATVCAGTMALLNAGVPLTEPISGIAMGLIKEKDKFAILSDILGDEDHLGDMDFKVCGGTRGITALQMDIKIGGLTREILASALAQAKEGRQHILEKVKAAITNPEELSEFAPRIFQLSIKPDKIRDLIGPGGKVIKKIVAETGAKIDISDEGIVSIVSPDVNSAEAAKKIIRSVTSDPEIGGIYLGIVKKIMDFGAFVEIKPGTEGLVHVSQLDNARVERVSDVTKEGEEMIVKVLEIDRQGKIKLSRKDAFGKKPTF